MGTKAAFNRQHLVFTDAAMAVSAGVITANQQVANSTTETVLVSETLAADFLTDAGTGTHFRVTLAGEISSTGTGDVELTLRYGTTDILKVTTVGLANEDDKQWELVYEGRVLTTGASGKVVAVGRMNIEQASALLVVNLTASAGVTVDTTADGSINVTAQWDAASADNDIIAMVGYVELFN